ncbi:phage tail spike protein [Clostridium saudiense]|uniref:phage tail spike protein n=1 Tax=Clostridium saudiense TaxID=1414720 RepID=UPI00266EFBF4|nr:phage tail spike protein [Clostridium saudiense]
MIEIYLKTNTNYDKNGDITLDPTSCTYKESEKELTLEHFLDEDGRWKYINFENVIAAEENGKKKFYRIYNVVRELYSVTAYARPIFYDLIDKVLLDVRPTNKIGQEALDIILADTGFTGHSNISNLSTAYYVRKNIVEALLGNEENSFLNRWGGEFYCENFDVYINDKIGSDNGVRVEFGYNLNEIEEDVNIEEVVTRIIPVGYDGIMLDGETPWVDSPLINKYTQPKMRVIEFSDVKVKESSDDEEGFDTIEEARAELIKQCNLLFDNGIDKPVINYKIDMINLANTTAYKDFKMLVEVNKGDTVTCYIKHLDIDVKARVIDYERDLITGEYTSIELGNAVSNFFNKQADIQSQVDNILNDNGSVNAGTVEGAINAIKTQFKALKDIAQPQDVRAIIFEDRVEDSPTFGCMCLGTMGFEIASSFKPGTKEWDFKTFGTGQGFYADYIVAGVLNANLIKTGIIRALNGESWINLDTGEAQITGELRSANGDEWVGLNAGGLTFQDWHRQEQVLRVASANFTENRDMNGIVFAMPRHSDFIGFSHIDKENLNDGWTTSDTQYNFLEMWSSDQLVDGFQKNKGISFYARAFFNGGIRVKSASDNSYATITGTSTYNNGTGITKKLLGLYGDNGVILGYKNADSLTARLIVSEECFAGTGDTITSFGNWNFQAYTLHNVKLANYTLTNTYANTETRTIAEVSALETNSTDNIRYVYKNITSKDNKIVLNIPNEYLGRDYDIVGVAKFGFGDYAIISKEENRFIIETDREITMNIEISIA